MTPKQTSFELNFKMPLLFLLALGSWGFYVPLETARAETYYVDGRHGSDKNDGLSPTAADSQHGPKKTWMWFS